MAHFNENDIVFSLSLMSRDPTQPKSWALE